MTEASEFERDAEYIRGFMRDVAALARKCKEPLDTKIEPLLAVIHAMAQEQLTLKKRYEWGSRPKPDDEFLDKTDIPSVDDLEEMMGGD